MLTVMETLPSRLLTLDAHELYMQLDGPTLIHLDGVRKPALFVSVLLHGNEVTGWQALRGLLLAYVGKSLPRALSVFIGNIEAARHGRRYLDYQPDYNRVWKLQADHEMTPEHAMMQQVVAAMSERGVFASIDVHNNTGLNPHYACVNTLDARALHLARMFSRTVVYFTQPDSVQSMAFARLCPAITIECGRPGQPYGQQHARELLDACLHLSELPQRPLAEGDIDLFHTMAVAKMPAHLTLGFGDDDCDVNFVADIDHLNFRELPAGTALAKIKHRQAVWVDVRDAHGADVSQRYFHISDDELRTALPVMPAMLSKSAEAIRQDCLCYLMERYPLETDSVARGSAAQSKPG